MIVRDIQININYGAWRRQFSGSSELFYLEKVSSLSGLPRSQKGQLKLWLWPLIQLFLQLPASFFNLLLQFFSPLLWRQMAKIFCDHSLAVGKDAYYFPPRCFSSVRKTNFSPTGCNLSVPLEKHHLSLRSQNRQQAMIPYSPRILLRHRVDVVTYLALNNLQINNAFKHWTTPVPTMFWGFNIQYFKG